MAPIRVLLVDDNEDFLESASCALSALDGVEVVGTAACGADAVARTEGLAPDLVLMDVTMPGMDGFAATALIKSRPAPPMVVIVTLHDIPEYRQAATTAGADGFVGKSDFGTAVPALILELFPEPANPGEAV